MTKVRKLIWEEDSISEGDIDYFFADTPWWEYEIKLIKGKYIAWEQEEEFDTLEEAKQWFQDWFEEIVLSCIEGDL